MSNIHLGKTNFSHNIVLARHEPRRYFDVVKGYEDKGVNLPERSTVGSAGYDIEAAETVVVPSIWRVLLSPRNIRRGRADNNLLKPTVIPTGVKAYMEKDEVLEVHVRSSTGIKKLLNMPNSTGIIDSDYAGNADNDGHIMVPLWNFGLKPYTVQKGERIAQGIFSQFLLVKDDRPTSETRTGGIGSTEENDGEN